MIYIQSDFCFHLSTETTLDLLDYLTQDFVSILIILDIPATFNTISHKFLLDRLQSIGIVDPLFLKSRKSYSDQNWLSFTDWCPTGIGSGPFVVFYLPTPAWKHFQKIWH